MQPSDDTIFPLVERETPILDRIRGRNDDSGTVSNDIGKLIGEAALEEDDDFILEQREMFEEKVTSSLAETMGVGEEDISQTFVSSLSLEMLSVEVEDVLDESYIKEIEAVGLDDEDEEEDDEVEEEEGPFA